MEYLHGIDTIIKNDTLLKNKRVGLITNPSGHDRNLCSAADVLRERYNLCCLYAPEHGIFGSSQAGEKIADSVDPETGIRVISLFGNDEKKLLSDIDVLVYSMQDVGLRFYTYIYTMTKGMKMAHDAGIPFVVLDRYNMLGLNRVSGSVLDMRFASGVGEYPLPSRYGLTCGELAQYANDQYHIGCALHVIPSQGLSRKDDMVSLRLPYLPPSPNLPAFSSVVCYVGTVLFEGTNISEGRGTTRPFECFGAPWINPKTLLSFIQSKNFKGALFRSTYFRPTFSKYKGELCGGIEIILRDHNTFDAFYFTLTVLNYLKNEYPEFSFLPPDANGYFIDKLLGGDALRSKDFHAENFIENEKEKLEKFQKSTLPYQIYR